MVTLNGRKLYIDMDSIPTITPTVLTGINAAWRKVQDKRKLDPFNIVSNRRYTPEELQARIEEYFKSCEGYKYYKGKLVLDHMGKPVICQVKPYTLSGLERYLKLSHNTLRRYEQLSRSGLIPPEYAEIIVDARQRVQEYAEERLYDREGSSGARFVLEVGFGWMTKMDKKALKQSKERIELTREKLDFLKQQAEEGKLTDTEFTVNILRADNDN